eukprot:4268522-Amphidinium_carterae.1
MSLKVPSKELESLDLLNLGLQTPFGDALSVSVNERLRDDIMRSKLADAGVTRTGLDTRSTTFAAASSNADWEAVHASKLIAISLKVACKN